MPIPLFANGLPRSNPLANNTSHSSSFVIRCHWRCSIPSHAISSSNMLLCSQASHCPWGIALCSSHSLIQVLSFRYSFLSHFWCPHRTRLFCVTSFTYTLVLLFLQRAPSRLKSLHTQDKRLVFPSINFFIQSIMILRRATRNMSIRNRSRAYVQDWEQ